MSRAAGYISDADIGASTYDAKAVIPSANDTVWYVHLIGLAYMDSISVGAVGRGEYTKIFCPDVLGQNDGYVETHGVNRGDLSYNPIDYMIEFYRLRRK